MHESQAHVALKNRFCTAVTDIFGYYSCDLLHVPFLASAILRVNRPSVQTVTSRNW